MPTGPTMSGPLPDAISVARASFAPAYGTASNVRWILSWLWLNFSTTCFSTATCSGASPPPRQQYQRMSVWPGAAVDPPIAIGVLAGPDAPGDAASDAAGDSAPVDAPADSAAGDSVAWPCDATTGVLACGALLGLVPLHAPATSATTAMAAVARIIRIAPPREPGCRRRSAAVVTGCGGPPPRCRVATSGSRPAPCRSGCGRRGRTNGRAPRVGPCRRTRDPR